MKILLFFGVLANILNDRVVCAQVLVPEFWNPRLKQSLYVLAIFVRHQFPTLRDID